MARKSILEVIEEDVPIVECNGKLPLKSDLVVFKFPNGEERVGLKPEDYSKFMELLEHLWEENFQFRLEQEILKTLPIDLEDVKSVVINEMEDNQELSIPEAVEKVKREHPNLFHHPEEIKFLNQVFEKLEEELLNKE